MGMILTEAKRPQVGEYHYRKVLELSRQRDPILLANLAWNLKNQGKMEEARTLYEESVAAAPTILQTCSAGRGWRKPTAISTPPPTKCSTADGLAPDDPSITLSRAVLRGRTKATTRRWAMLDGMAEQAEGGRLGPTNCSKRAGCSTRWAATTRRSPRSPKASASAARDQRQPIWPPGAAADQPAQAAFHRQPAQDRCRAPGVRDDVPQPIFILGFPRSGTTLVEQTLSAHPRHLGRRRAALMSTTSPG
jgi:tetratricopeptide (TPR) repeat protein